MTTFQQPTRSVAHPGPVAAPAVSIPDASAVPGGPSPREVIVRGWLPFRRSGRTVGVATTVPATQQLVDQVRSECDADEVDFEAVTAEELAAVVSVVFRDRLIYEIGESLAVTQPERSAKSSLTRWQQLTPLVGLALLVIGLVVAPRITIISMLTLSAIAFSATIAFRTFAVGLWPLKRVRQRIGLRLADRRRTVEPGPSDHDADAIADDDLPMYTILVPVFHEANIISTLIGNLGNLDYPRDKLEVLVLLEKDDVETIAAAWASNPPPYMRTLIVPAGQPQTKPRACNYGLTFARGELVVIYDAEDRPEPDQLRRVAADFRRARAEAAAGSTAAPLACVQCSLSYFNASYNVLTRLFAIEYSYLFDAILPGLDGTGIPIPLGGTSNHFDAAMLRQVGGWDPYNVTEDADLGIRAAALGYRIGVNTSTTWEEACSQAPAFIKQRTRWIKGYLITAAVNFRHPVQFAKATRLRGVLCLLALILGTPAAFLAYPLMLAFAAITLAGEKWGFLALPGWLSTTGILTMLIGTGLTIVLSGLVAWPRYGWRIAVYAVFSPVYWLLHSVAAWRAAWQTMVRPHHWEKTPHGLSDDLDEADFADIR